MLTKTQQKTKKSVEIKQLRAKAAILDELIEVIEDKYFGHLMNLAEKEKSVPLSKAKKLLR